MTRACVQVLLVILLLSGAGRAVAESSGYEAIRGTDRVLGEGKYAVEVRAWLNDVSMPPYQDRALVTDLLETKLSNYAYDVADALEAELDVDSVHFQSETLRIDGVRIERLSNGSYDGRAVEGRFEVVGFRY